MTDYTLHFYDRDTQVMLTPAAEKAMQNMQAPLTAEMELYFSCLLRKKVRFYADRAEGQILGGQLHIAFRPVMTAVCGNDYIGDEPPVTDFPIVKPAPYVPKWLKLDFSHGQWQGEFGYTPAN